jgi:hypothetical protein
VLVAVGHNSDYNWSAQSSVRINLSVLPSWPNCVFEPLGRLQVFGRFKEDLLALGRQHALTAPGGTVPARYSLGIRGPKPPRPAPSTAAGRRWKKVFDTLLPGRRSLRLATLFVGVVRAAVLHDKIDYRTGFMSAGYVLLGGAGPKAYLSMFRSYDCVYGHWVGRAQTSSSIGGIVGLIHISLVDNISPFTSLLLAVGSLGNTWYLYYNVNNLSMTPSRTTLIYCLAGYFIFLFTRLLVGSLKRAGKNWGRKLKKATASRANAARAIGSSLVVLSGFLLVIPYVLNMLDTHAHLCSKNLFELEIDIL